MAGVVALDDGVCEAYRTRLLQALDDMLRSGFSGPAPSPGAEPAPQNAILDALLSAVPFIAAAVFALVFALNLWLAAKVVQMSGRLPRPWPFIPATMMPGRALLILVGAAALCL